MLTLWQLVATDATTPTLKRAILASMVVNMKGRDDSWLSVNLINKLLNLELKIELYARGNSTFNVNYLFNTTVLTSRYSSNLKRVFEKAFCWYIRG
jgi:hypothetical protein